MIVPVDHIKSLDEHPINFLCWGQNIRGELVNSIAIDDLFPCVTNVAVPLTAYGNNTHEYNIW